MRKLIAAAALVTAIFAGSTGAHAGAVCVFAAPFNNCLGVPIAHAKVYLATVEGGLDAGGPQIGATGVRMIAKPDNMQGAVCVLGSCGRSYGATIDYGQFVIRLYLPSGCYQFGPFDFDFGSPCHNP